MADGSYSEVEKRCLGLRRVQQVPRLPPESSRILASPNDCLARATLVCELSSCALGCESTASVSFLEIKGRCSAFFEARP